ncbi:MAG: hypothetical protein AAFO07_06270, partial [Bacteroidota bacterium]
DNSKDVAESIVGTWQAVSIRVAMNSFEGTELDSIFEVSEEYWIDRFSIKPVITKYQPDNKYVQTFYNQYDSLINEAKGIWNVFGDTLMLIEPNATYTYQVEMDKGLARFNALLDWDGDGAEDDEYVGVHRYVSKSY